MKVLAISAFLIAISLQVGCSVTQSSPGPKTEWEIANKVAILDFDAGNLGPVEMLRRIYMNCMRFTGYSFQKELCTAASDMFSIDNAITRGIGMDILEMRHDDIRAYAIGIYPMLPMLKRRLDDCMLEETNTVQKLTCVDMSRVLENFAKGRIGLDETLRQFAQLRAIAQAYQTQGPSIADVLFGAMKIYADSLPKTYNCSGTVSGNQVYAQCR